MDFVFCYSKIAFANQCRAKAIAFDNAQAESFFSRFKAELMEGGVFENLNKPAVKSLAISKVITIESGYIQVWAVKVQWNSRWNYKLQMEETKDSFLSKKT